MLIEVYFLLVAATQSQPVQGPVAEDPGAICDRLTASLNDPFRPSNVASVRFEDIEADKAIAACEAAAEFRSDQPRYRYQLGRALASAKRLPDGVAAYRQAAEQGYPAAMIALGRDYEGGEGVEQNFAQAMFWYRKASTAGLISADGWIGWLQSRKNTIFEDYEQAALHLQTAFDRGYLATGDALGDAYYYGYGVKWDLVKARQYYLVTAAAKQGSDSMRSAWSLAFMWENGLGGAMDLDEARRLYQQAAKLGSNKALVSLANLDVYSPRDKQSVAKGIEEFRTAAANGNMRAMFELGYAYDLGKGVPADARQARVWYEKAIAAGDIGAYTNLGYLYDTGALSADGHAPDSSKAQELYLKAANNGDASAMANTAYSYRDGYAGAVDKDKSLFWFTKAAYAGSDKAMYELGNYYSANDDETRNDVMAFDWHRRAADLGNSNAKVSMAWDYENGAGVAKDYDKAMIHYKDAARLGNALAMNNIGAMYELGEGVGEDKLAAFEWYKKAVLKEDLPLAHNNIALCYRDGVGVERNSRKAAEHVWLSLSNGETSSWTALKEEAKWPKESWEIIQTKLQKAGYFKGRVDGKSSILTQLAIESYYLASGGVK
jgi:TPR repeat protein